MPNPRRRQKVTRRRQSASSVARRITLPLWTLLFALVLVLQSNREVSARRTIWGVSKVASSVLPTMAPTQHQARDDDDDDSTTPRKRRKRTRLKKINEANDVEINPDKSIREEEDTKQSATTTRRKRRRKRSTDPQAAAALAAPPAPDVSSNTLSVSAAKLEEPTTILITRRKKRQRQSTNPVPEATSTEPVVAAHASGGSRRREQHDSLLPLPSEPRVKRTRRVKKRPKNAGAPAAVIASKEGNISPKHQDTKQLPARETLLPASNAADQATRPPRQKKRRRKVATARPVPQSVPTTDNVASQVKKNGDDDAAISVDANAVSESDIELLLTRNYDRADSNMNAHYATADHTQELPSSLNVTTEIDNNKNVVESIGDDNDEPAALNGTTDDGFFRASSLLSLPLHLQLEEQDARNEPNDSNAKDIIQNAATDTLDEINDALVGDIVQSEADGDANNALVAKFGSIEKRLNDGADVDITVSLGGNENGAPPSPAAREDRVNAATSTEPPQLESDIQTSAPLTISHNNGDTATAAISDEIDKISSDDFVGNVKESIDDTSTEKVNSSGDAPDAKLADATVTSTSGATGDPSSENIERNVKEPELALSLAGAEADTSEVVEATVSAPSVIEGGTSIQSDDSEDTDGDDVVTSGNISQLLAASEPTSSASDDENTDSESADTDNDEASHMTKAGPAASASGNDDVTLPTTGEDVPLLAAPTQVESDGGDDSDSSDSEEEQTRTATPILSPTNSSIVAPPKVESSSGSDEDSSDDEEFQSDTQPPTLSSMIASTGESSKESSTDFDDTSSDEDSQLAQKPDRVPTITLAEKSDESDSSEDTDEDSDGETGQSQKASVSHSQTPVQVSVDDDGLSHQLSDDLDSERVLRPEGNITNQQPLNATSTLSYLDGETDRELTDDSDDEGSYDETTQVTDNSPDKTQMSDMKIPHDADRATEKTNTSIPLVGKMPPDSHVEINSTLLANELDKKRAPCALDLQSVINSTDTDEDITVSVVTWNLAEESPSEVEAKFLKKFRNYGSVADKGNDIVFIGCQECENIKPRRTEGRRSREIRRLMIKMLGKQYVPLAIHSLGGIQFGLFCKRKILKDIEAVSLGDVTCGIGNVFHNKGAIGAFLQMKARPGGALGAKETSRSVKMMFITAHMAAHVKNVEARDLDFWRIVSELESQAPPQFLSAKKQATQRDDGANSILLDSADRIFFCGDLNYRLELPREEAEFSTSLIQNYLANDASPEQRRIADKLRASMLEHDQLLHAIAEERAFPGFVEGRIKFPPTFKFDKNSLEEYDTSHKQRIPAWTDRILYKPTGTRVLEYDWIQDARHSDHRPVYAIFRVNMAGRQVEAKKSSRRTKRRSSSSKKPKE
ncbi:inositol polyphosphate 5-phosphatase [Mayamaea pseudoterrestris]|nr:inositol polyphosphate 5-phosphatase [Mayamaea pseudoterrestris]